MGEREHILGDAFKGKRVAIFGLSANPPTGDGGHRGVVRYLVETGHFDRILIMPVYQHIFTAKKAMLPFDIRSDMCRLNFENLSVPECDVRVTAVEKVFYEIELARLAGGTPTIGSIDILQYLGRENPGVQFHLVLGLDCYRDIMLKKWRQSDVIVTSTPLEVIGRLEVTLSEEVERSELKNKGQVRFHNIPALTAVSSTIIRGSEPSWVGDVWPFLGIRKYLYQPVYDYIRAKNLYAYSGEETNKRVWRRSKFSLIGAGVITAASTSAWLLARRSAPDGRLTIWEFILASLSPSKIKTIK
jgi:nicotinic acid mononucleotide adenylyltransferase